MPIDCADAHTQPISVRRFVPTEFARVKPRGCQHLRSASRVQELSGHERLRPNIQVVDCGNESSRRIALEIGEGTRILEYPVYIFVAAGSPWHDLGGSVGKRVLHPQGPKDTIR